MAVYYGCGFKKRLHDCEICGRADDPSGTGQFCDVLVYNWQQRLKELFPHKKIIVETGNEIMGELGLTITVQMGLRVLTDEAYRL
ncbi:hypothetical protein ADH76_34570 [Enterocloster clostridioformis]|nr:hypothetical protein A4V08_35655 [Lachnoclostridium sp. YL32]NDO27303.1 hypothetical protein [Enterocloster clostridioformis]OXE61591.1 hypothetical protein ADH76_34570 [Enterocloster clostridioformis]